MLTGTQLLQRVAERIISAWLGTQGYGDVHLTAGRQSAGGRSVDLTYAYQGGIRRAKVKPDAYFGTDPAKINDRALSFYRPESGTLALEAVANAATREPGWMLESDADDLYYYYVAIAQPEEEVRALAAEPDEVFFSELGVDRDDLIVVPLREARVWFETSYERYPSRPVIVSGAAAWYRLVPRADLEREVAGVRDVGPVFRSVAR